MDEFPVEKYLQLAIECLERAVRRDYARGDVPGTVALAVIAGYRDEPIEATQARLARPLPTMTPAEAEAPRPPRRGPATREDDPCS